MTLITKIVFLLGVFCLTSGAVQAELADRTRPIQVEANSVRMDDVKKNAVYEGKVILTQGTLTITADRIDVSQDAKGMTGGEATGQPVHFRQKMEGRNEYLEARALRIEYDARAETMKLIGNALLNQGSDELRGAIIIYDVRSEHYRAEGTTEDGKQGRVRAMIRPRNEAPDNMPTSKTGVPVKP